MLKEMYDAGCTYLYIGIESMSEPVIKRVHKNINHSLHWDQRVRMALAQNFASTSQERAARYPVLGNGQSAKMGWHMQDYNPHGAAGNAEAATAEKGQALIDSAGEQLAHLLRELAAMPLTTLRV